MSNGYIYFEYNYRREFPLQVNGRIYNSFLNEQRLVANKIFHNICMKYFVDHFCLFATEIANRLTSV